MPKDELPLIMFGDQAALESWLEENAETSPGIWLKLAKKGAPEPTVNYVQAVEASLCFGWIDGQAGAIDEHYSKQRFTPRRPKGKWSRINTDRVARLTAEGKMRPRGQREVDSAKADGRWDAAYEPPSTMVVPPDLQAVLDTNAVAAENWAKLNKANKFAMGYRLTDAKKPETRLKRLTQFVAMLEAGEKLY